MTKFAERLEIAMAEYGYNKNQLANRIGVSSASVSRWYTRDSVPGIDTIEKIAELFHVDQRWLIGSIDEMRPQLAAEIKKDEPAIDDELVSIIKTLNSQQLQRLKDFLAGLRG